MNDDMARLKSKDFRADSGKCFPPGTHRPPLWWGSSNCCWLLVAPSPASADGTSFFFFTNSKNSATWRAYLQQSKNFKINKKCILVLLLVSTDLAEISQLSNKDWRTDYGTILAMHKNITKKWTITSSVTYKTSYMSFLSFSPLGFLGLRCTERRSGHMIWGDWEKEDFRKHINKQTLSVF